MPTVSYSRLNDFWRCRDNVPPVLFTGGHQLARVGPSGEPLMRAVGRLSRVKWVRQTKIASALFGLPARSVESLIGPIGIRLPRLRDPGLRRLTQPFTDPASRPRTK